MNTSLFQIISIIWFIILSVVVITAIYYFAREISKKTPLQIAIINLAVSLGFYALFTMMAGMGSAYSSDSPVMKVYLTYANLMLLCPVITFLIFKFVEKGEVIFQKKFTLLRILLIMFIFSYPIWGYLVLDFITV